MEKPKLPESILPVVPTGVQFAAAADADAGNTNAQNANTTPKTDALFVETIFNIRTPSREHRTVRR